MSRHPDAGKRYDDRDLSTALAIANVEVDAAAVGHGLVPPDPARSKVRAFVMLPLHAELVERGILPPGAASRKLRTIAANPETARQGVVLRQLAVALEGSMAQQGTAWGEEFARLLMAETAAEVGKAAPDPQAIKARAFAMLAVHSELVGRGAMPARVVGQRLREIGASPATEGEGVVLRYFAGVLDQGWPKLA